MRTRTTLFTVCFAIALTLPCAAQPSEWCVDLDQISAVAHDSTITVTHAAAFYNCCPVDIVYALEQQGSLFIIHETEVEPQCLCFCCFNLSVDIEHVAPGTYDLEFHWYNMETGPAVRFLQVTVPDLGQEPEAALGARQISACLGTTGAEDRSGISRAAPRLWPAAPNPTTTSTRLRYQLPAAGPARLAVYSAAGAEVRTLFLGLAEGGPQEAFWDGKDRLGRSVPGGAYFCRLEAAGSVATRLIILLD